MATSASSSTSSTRGLSRAVEADDRAIARAAVARLMERAGFRQLAAAGSTTCNAGLSDPSRTSPCRRAAARCWRVMTFRPKLRDDGGAIRGPPFSAQCRVSASRLQLPGRALTLPFGDDSAPCLAALVASSCSASARPCAVAGCSEISGPLTSTLSPVAVGRQLLVDQRAEIGALPARFRQQRMRARQRPDAAFDRRDVVVDALGARQPDDRLHHGERIAGAMIDLARQQHPAAPRPPCAR